MDPSHLPRLMAILQATAPAASPLAADDPTVQADGICADCHRAMSWRGLATDAVGSRLICTDCRAAIDAKPKRLRLLPIVAHPFTWVGAAMVLAVVLYLGGAGNIRPGHYATLDADKPWYKQRDALMWLAQARRIDHRLVVLKEVNGPESERRKWAELQVNAFGELIDHWQDEDEVVLDLVVGLSIAKTHAGKTADAYEWLYKIAKNYAGASDQDDRYLTYLTHRGIASLAISETAPGLQEVARRQGVADLELVLHALATEDLSRAGERTIDQMLDTYTVPAGKDKAAVRRELQQICQSELPRGRLLDMCLEALASHGIRSTIAGEARKSFDMNVPINPTDARPDAGLVIERLDD